MIITIDGPPGSGKSTISKLLSEKLKMPLESVGNIFRAMAKARKVSLAEFGKIAETDENIDRELDKKTVDIAKGSDNLVIEGRLTGIMLLKNNIKAFKVYIFASIDTRAKRISGRDNQKKQDAWKDILIREKSENTRYEKIYGIRQGRNDFYDAIIDTDNKKPDDIVNDIIQELRKWQKRNL